MDSHDAFLDFLDERGSVIGTLRVVQADNGPPGLRLLSPLEAREHGEERIQLIEGRAYDFELQSSRCGIRICPGGICKPSSIRPEIGRIEPGLETGLCEICLEDAPGGTIIARAAIEVVSSKIDYRSDYRGMLGFIAAECSQLLFDIRASGRLRLVSSNKVDSANHLRQFEFLSAELTSQRFRAALKRIMAMPHQRLEPVAQRVKIERMRRGGKEFARQIGLSGSRRPLLGESTVARLMADLDVPEPSLPAWIVQRGQIESLDTPENRFVKHVLVTFSALLDRIEAALKARPTLAQSRLIRRVELLRQILDEPLRHQALKSLREPRMLPLGSPVLQRKSGYREVLEAWLKFEMSSQLAWHGGDDVYSAGKRDIATLYEYWVFFQLLRLFQDKFGSKNTAAAALFEASNGGLSLRLKAGEALGIHGSCVRGSRNLCARLSYNLTQGASRAREVPGSWTRRMRPDYTLSFWPEGFSIDEAEAQELAVHVHFDAKYRVENISDLFGLEDESSSIEKRDESRGNYKRADLLKMHAYRDAIRRSEGAYVIYPGDSHASARFQGFHEILPGLGAFAIKPGPDGQGLGLQQLSRFLDEVIDHVCDRTTARERHSFHRFDTYREATTAAAPLGIMLPERDEESGQRATPPAEHPVLVGWCDGPAQLDWIRKSGLYNLRAGTRRGSVRLDPAITAARHLLLHSNGGKALPGLWRIKVLGPRIFTADELLRTGYPSKPDPDVIYAVFDVEVDTFYSEWKWDYSRLAGRKEGRASAAPFAVSLADVLSMHRP